MSSFSLITQENVFYGLFATLLVWHAGNRMGENSWGTYKINQKSVWRLKKCNRPNEKEFWISKYDFKRGLAPY